MATPMTAMMMVGVTAPITLDTLSTSSMPTIKTKTSMSVEPIQVFQPNCCSILEPAPANITKPIAKRVMMTAMSSNLETIGWVTLRKTVLCSEAWK